MNTAIDIATRVVQCGGSLRMRGDNLEIAGPVPDDLRNDVARRSPDLVAWVTGHCRGQDAAGLARMARARRAAGIPLTSADTAALVIMQVN